MFFYFFLLFSWFSGGFPTLFAFLMVLGTRHGSPDLLFLLFLLPSHTFLLSTFAFIAFFAFFQGFRVVLLLFLLFSWFSDGFLIFFAFLMVLGTRHGFPDLLFLLFLLPSHTFLLSTFAFIAFFAFFKGFRVVQLLFLLFSRFSGGFLAFFAFFMVFCSCVCILCLTLK